MTAFALVPERLYRDVQKQVESLRSRMALRCFEEGHTYEHVDDIGDVCRWCDVVAAVDDRAISDEERFAA